MSERIRTFAEFWPFYLREHGRPTTRALHFAGTTLGVGLGVGAAVTGRALLVPAALVSEELMAQRQRTPRTEWARRLEVVG